MCLSTIPSQCEMASQSFNSYLFGEHQVAVVHNNYMQMSFKKKKLEKQKHMVVTCKKVKYG
jgi:hypothetical protein